MNARQENALLHQKIAARGILIDWDSVNKLRLAEKTLHRWAERECGDGSGWHIERDEETGKPLNVRDDTGKGYAIADREAGALNRVRHVCEAHGLHYYHQTDPRGCALYISREPMTDSDYSTRGVAVCA